MSAIWTYATGVRYPGSEPLPVGTQGAAQLITGSVVMPIAWLDARKGSPIINGTISTEWDSNPQYCSSVSHTVDPPLPSGISITDITEIGGITVSGLSDNLLTTNIKNNYTDIHDNMVEVNTNSLPPDSMLTHYSPLSAKYLDYTIVITVVWIHDNNNQSSDSAAWILRLWNSWVNERQDVIGIAEKEVKGG